MELATLLKTGSHPNLKQKVILGLRGGGGVIPAGLFIQNTLYYTCKPAILNLIARGGGIKNMYKI